MRPASVSKSLTGSELGVDRFLDHPGGIAKEKLTDHRPALAVGVLPTGTRKWTLWYHLKIEPDGPTFPNTYFCLTSSHEIPIEGGSKVNVFSRSKMVKEYPYPTATNNKNVSLAFYREKLRASIAYDNYAVNDPGYILLPLADGIFHARLKDVNDVGIIADRMASSTTPGGHRMLFDGMTDTQLEEIEEANHVQIPRDIQHSTYDIEPDWLSDPAGFLETDTIWGDAGEANP